MIVEGFELREDRYYTPEHVWVKVRVEGEVEIGLDGFLGKMLEDLAYIDLAKKGSRVKRMEELGSVESSKWVGKVLSPVSGVITDVNLRLFEDKSLISKDPYGDGWLVRIKPSNLGELEQLLRDEEARRWFEKDVKLKLAALKST